MKLFVDTANINEIKEVNSWGIISGVTTNPTLIAKENREFHQTVKEICGIVEGPVSAEVISTEFKGMVEEARVLSSLAKNVVVKIPMTIDGLKAVNVLHKEDINTNVTLIFSANQALLAARAGATFVSPFVGRLDDMGSCGMELVADIAQIFYNYDIRTEIIAASIRHPMHVIEAAKAGAHISTCPYDVLVKMTRHPMTDIGIERFLIDWEKVKDLK